jgi:protein TonB
MPEPPEEEEEEEDFFVAVENMPKLKGGLAGLQRKITYPEMARKAGIEGTVTIQFIVNKNGKVEDPRVLRGIGGGCDEEALRVVKEAEFTPGRQRGNPVRVQYSLPIRFQLQN